MIDRLLPCVGWLKRYNGETFHGDALAAVIVTIMLIPQSLAYALLAGLPPEVGLYASMLPLVGYALFGSSNALAVGPVAVVSLMTATGPTAGGHTLYDLVGSLAGGIDETNLPTLAIGALATAFLFWVRARLKPLLRRFGLGPRLADAGAKAGPVVAVIATIAAVELLALDAAGVAVVGAIPQGLPPLSVPPLDPGLWLELLPSAVLISIVGFVESVSVAQTLAAKRRERIAPNRELIGLGAANIAASMSGGYPVTGGFARSVVNFDAGARTPLAGVLTAVGIGLTALFLTPLFHQLPKATLAATIVVAVLSLVDLGALKRTWTYSKADFAAMAVTIATVLGFGVEAGITAGVGLSLVLFLARSARPHLAVVGQVPGTHHFRNVRRHAVVTSPKVFSVRVDESLYFANARWLEDTLYDRAVADKAIEDVVLICAAVNDIDASALEALEGLNERLHAAGVRFHLSEVKGPVMDKLKRTHFLDALTGQVFLSHYDAMAALDPDTTQDAELSPAVRA